jgi:hypothetical protein
MLSLCNTDIKQSPLGKNSWSPKKALLFLFRAEVRVDPHHHGKLSYSEKACNSSQWKKSQSQSQGSLLCQCLFWEREVWTTSSFLMASRLDPGLTLTMRCRIQVKATILEALHLSFARRVSRSSVTVVSSISTIHRTPKIMGSEMTIAMREIKTATSLR